MAVKKHKLEMAMEEDFCLLGMVSDEKDYRLCWLINRAMNVDFRREDNLELYHKRLKVKQQFANFSFNDEHAFLNYRIIKNRSEEGFFLDEVKNLDYLIHIQGELSETHIRYFMQGIGDLPEIRMLIPVDLRLIRQSAERLYLW